MSGPLVSVITPTWQRHDLLLHQAVPSVAEQTYQHVEHVVVSDGPDGRLRRQLEREALSGVRFAELPTHDPTPDNWGSHARNHGLTLARGELVAYLDDDNTFRPDHLERLVAAMTADPEADFAYSRMLVHPHRYVVGAAPPVYGQVDSSLLMHRAGVPERLGCWPPPGQIPHADQHAPDWGVVSVWLAGGARWVFVDAVTVDYHSQR